MSVVTAVVSGAPAGLPAPGPAGRAAAAVCSPGRRELGSAAGAAGTPPDDPALQPAHTTEQQNTLRDYQTVCGAGLLPGAPVPCVTGKHRRHRRGRGSLCGPAAV